MKRISSTPLSSIEKQISAYESSKEASLLYVRVKIKNTRAMAQEYSSPVSQPIVFKESRIKRAGISITLILLLFMLSISVERNYGVLSFLLVWLGSSLALLYGIYRWRSSRQKSLTISNEGITWGTEFYAWAEVVDTYIAIARPGKKIPRESLYIYTIVNTLIHIPLNSIIDLFIFSSDIASAIEHFRQRYLRSIIEQE